MRSRFPQPKSPAEEVIEINPKRPAGKQSTIRRIFLKTMKFLILASLVVVVVTYAMPFTPHKRSTDEV